MLTLMPALDPTKAHPTRVQMTFTTTGAKGAEVQFVGYSRTLSASTISQLRALDEAFNERMIEARSIFPTTMEQGRLEADIQRFSLVDDDEGRRAVNDLRRQRATLLQEKFEELEREGTEGTRATETLKLEHSLTVARFMIDPTTVKNADHVELLQTSIASEFWQSQDVAALEEAVASFRSLRKS